MPSTGKWNGERHLPPPPDNNIMPFEQQMGILHGVIASGPAPETHSTIVITAIYSARKIVMTTYFVPSDDLAHAIQPPLCVVLMSNCATK